MFRTYCVVYLVSGMHYRYRCNAETAWQARRMACNSLGISQKDIVETYVEKL